MATTRKLLPLGTLVIAMVTVPMTATASADVCIIYQPTNDQATLFIVPGPFWNHPGTDNNCTNQSNTKNGYGPVVWDWLDSDTLPCPPPPYIGPMPGEWCGQQYNPGAWVEVTVAPFILLPPEIHGVVLCFDLPDVSGTQAVYDGNCDRRDSPACYDFNAPPVVDILASTICRNPHDVDGRAIVYPIVREDQRQADDVHFVEINLV